GDDRGVAADDGVARVAVELVARGAAEDAIDAVIAVDGVDAALTRPHGADFGHVAGGEDALRARRLVDDAVVAEDDVVAGAAADRVVARRKPVAARLGARVAVGDDDDVAG